MEEIIMKKYNNPFIEILDLELADVLTISPNDANDNFGDLDDWQD